MGDFTVVFQIICVLLTTPVFATISYPTVQVDSGELKGITDDAVMTADITSPRTITKFLGIPYAAPPVGSLRFKAPQPVASWQGVREAVTYGDMCPQYLSATAYSQAYQDIYYKHNRTSEDCLTLNIFSPVKPEVSQNPLPVLVWIHGGAFKWGTGMNSDGTQLALQGNVIVVTFNYRLNVFGFMSINTSGASTNNGLRDQIAALQWVKKNIAAFGGDVNRVTIFGNSAGSVSATVLIVSPLARELFSRAILQSGTVYYKHLLKVDEGFTASKVMVNNSGCEHEDNDKTFECLQNLSAEKLLKAWSTSVYMNDPIVPQYGDDVIPAEPGHLFKTGQVADIDVILGGNKHDGVGYVPGTVLRGQVTMDKAMYERELSKTIRLFYPHNTNKVFATVSYNYGKSINTGHYKLEYLNAQTDRMLYDIQYTADLLVSSKRTVYFYMFTHTPAVRILPWPTWVIGGHGDEIQFVFGDQLDPDGGTGSTEEERTLSRQMMKAWANFAKTGDPNEVDPAVKWQKYTLEKREYLEININMNGTNSLEDYRSKEMSFWREVIPEVASADDCMEAVPVEHSDQMVKVKQGIMKGLEKMENGRTWEEYLGIPYAAPPGRWRRPKPHTKWTGVLNVTKYGAQCHDYFNTPLPDWLKINKGDEFSEDCLYLNVFVPRGVKYVRYMSLPVIIWLHGRAYNTTMNSFYPGHGLALFGSVIVVTVHYRTGALGYLPAGSANYALYDEQLAIKWVYENIENFGGNPLKITLIGQSAGAVTATLQALSPLNKGMIKNVIAQSGSPLSPWGINRYNHFNEVKQLAEYFDCASKDTSLMMNCLREVPAKNIAQAPIRISHNTGYWGPVVDGNFLPKDPIEMIRDGALKDINFIVGSNYNGGYGMASLFPDDVLGSANNLSIALAEILAAMYVNDEIILSSLKYNFLSEYDKKSDGEKLMALTDLFTEMMYAAPAQLQAETQASVNGKVYLYTFRYRSGLYPSRPTWVEGNHLDEGYYVMGGPAYLNTAIHNQSDEMVAAHIMTYWTNFAKYGDPNKGYQVPEPWPQFTLSDKKLMELSDMPTVKMTYRWRATDFWNRLVPALEGSKHPTCPARTTDGTITTGEQTTTPVSKDPDGGGEGDNGEDSDDECIKSIGPLYLSARQAHRLLWALGFLVGFLFIFSLIMVAYVIYERRKTDKKKLSHRRGTDNGTFTSAM